MFRNLYYYDNRQGLKGSEGLEGEKGFMGIKGFKGSEVCCYNTKPMHVPKCNRIDFSGGERNRW